MRQREKKNGAKRDLDKDVLVLLAAEKHGHEMTRQKLKRIWTRIRGGEIICWASAGYFSAAVFALAAQNLGAGKLNQSITFLFVYESLIADNFHPTIILCYILGICIQHKVPHCLSASAVSIRRG